jgi:hypothetical protein
MQPEQSAHESEDEPGGDSLGRAHAHIVPHQLSMPQSGHSSIQEVQQLFWVPHEGSVLHQDMQCLINAPCITPVLLTLH